MLPFPNLTAIIYVDPAVVCTYIGIFLELLDFELTRWIRRRGGGGLALQVVYMQKVKV